MPEPLIPCPSVCLAGRLWLLRPAAPCRGGMQIDADGLTFGLTGDYWQVRSLHGHWSGVLHLAVRQEVERQMSRLTPGESPEFRAARAELALQGSWQSGDLLYVPGNPTFLGHVLPAHQNRVLGRYCDRDLAIAAVLKAIPPAIGSYSLVVLQRLGERWQPYSPPHGICLGTLKPEDLHDPGVTLFEYLRAAAVQLAANGRFHSSD